MRCSPRKAPTTRRGSAPAGCWIIDPLDGTREYAEGRDDWAVHVALAVDGAPRIGAVAVPARGRLFRSDRCAAPPAPQRARPLMLVSRTRPPAEAEEIAALLGAELVPMGSAGAKAMAVVAGEADLYYHAGGQHEWDNCAPAAVALGAGLHASRVDGSPLVYNRRRHADARSRHRPARIWPRRIVAFTQQIGAQAQPGLALLLEWQACISRAARGQVDQRRGRRSPASWRAADPRRGAAVEGDGAQLRQRRGERGEVAGFVEADVGVEAALAGRGRDRVPEADAGVEQGLQPLLIGERDEVAADHRADQPPELVLRMGVITAAAPARPRPAGCRGRAGACRGG